jgi:hypothetical protein
MFRSGRIPWMKVWNNKVMNKQATLALAGWRSAQAIAFRGVGFDNVWPEFLAICGLGMAAFLGSLAMFRRSIAATG